MQELRVKRERALLMGLALPGGRAQAEESLEELRRLTLSAGAEVLRAVLQARSKPDPATYFGKGKVEEIHALAGELDCRLVVADCELKPSQQRELEGALALKVLDRTQLILDIFAQRAQRAEGKLQVELAQLSYLLPRLQGMGAILSRLGGGIGTRGPGESKLETDRRRIRDRMVQLRHEISEVARTRLLQRQGRRFRGAALAALAGYTNAGKSTLFNLLTGGQVYTQDRLFATLDPSVRALKGCGRAPLLLFDTVGFIRNLPHALVAAFKATLEEIAQADLIVRVVDASTEACGAHLEAVDGVLAEIFSARGRGAYESRRTMLVFNKTDLASPAELQTLRRRYPSAWFLSAWTGQGVLEFSAEQKRRMEPARIQG